MKHTIRNWIKKLPLVRGMVRKLNRIEETQAQLGRSIDTINKEVARAHNELRLVRDELKKVQIDLSAIHKDFENNRSKIQNDLAHKSSEIQQARCESVYYYNKLIPASQYGNELKFWYLNKTGKMLNLENPQNYSEKIQWMKLYDCTSLKTKLADKYLVRDWAKEKIGGQYLVPLVGVWDHFDEIDFDSLPQQFVLKANHGCGWNMIVEDKDSFNKAAAKNKFEWWLHHNFAFDHGFEMQYKDIPPKIIAEQYIGDGGDLFDYKIACFNGEAKYIWVDSERFTAHKRDVFDIEWNLQPFTIQYPNSPNIPARPKKLEEMIELATKLSQGFIHVRVDLYEVGGKVYFGEMTFTSGSGSEKFNPEEYDYIWGKMIDIPIK
jgi:hypothetical protein